jgi:release factor glutamine methyltransferase
MARTLRDALAAAGLSLGHTEGWRLDAEVLLCHLLVCPRIDLFRDPDRILTEDEDAEFTALLARRSQGEPVAYLTGVREFYGRPFFVGAGALIPRPETEALIDTVLAYARDAKPGLRIIDIGTGSGAIAITLALELPEAEVWASDLSDTALLWAKKNALALLGERSLAKDCTIVGPRVRSLAKDCTIVGLHLVQSDCFANIEGRFDLIVSNPPYLTAAELALAMPDVRDWEPASALVADEDGMAIYRRMMRELPDRLLPGGLVVFEISGTVAAGIQKEARAAGFSCEILPDLAGHQRLALLKHLSV